jgi:integrase
MAKGSVRKKGKKWYYRFYVEDASGNLVQKEYAGTESKSETEKERMKTIWRNQQRLMKKEYVH